MRTTVQSYPATIGVYALFAEVPGVWELSGNDYSLVSSDGFSVFMMREGLVASLNRGEDRKSVADAEYLISGFSAMFDKGVVSFDDVRMFSKEQGSDNVDFSRTVSEFLNEYKDHTLNQKMKRYDEMVQKFLNNRSSLEIDYLAHAFERVFAERKVRSSRELADIAFTGSVRPFAKINE